MKLLERFLRRVCGGHHWNQKQFWVFTNFSIKQKRGGITKSFALQKCSINFLFTQTKGFRVWTELIWLLLRSWFCAIRIPTEETKSITFVVNIKSYRLKRWCDNYEFSNRDLQPLIAFFAFSACPDSNASGCLYWVWIHGLNRSIDWRIHFRMRIILGTILGLIINLC